MQISYILIDLGSWDDGRSTEAAHYGIIRSV